MDLTVCEETSSLIISGSGGKKKKKKLLWKEAVIRVDPQSVKWS